MGRADVESSIRDLRRAATRQLSSTDHRHESRDNVVLGLDESDAGRPTTGSEVLVVLLVDRAEVLGDHGVR
ncbi:MAG TPA: hypothetical protein VIQ02_07895, partial [Jiangellaceae bacterium]